MRLKLTIHVTRDDIAEGNRRDCYSCPVALAVNRALGEIGLGHYKSKVSLADILIYDDKWIVMEMIGTNADVDSFISDFDATGDRRSELPEFTTTLEFQRY